MAAVFFILVLIGFGLAYIFQSAYAGKFYPGLRIGQLEVSGQTQEAVLNQLKSIEENIQNQGLIFSSGQKEVVINPIVISTSPDLAKRILSLDLEQTVVNAYEVGRSGYWWQNLGSRVKNLIFGQRVAVVYQLDQAELLSHLKASFSDLEKPPLDASLKFEGDQVEVIGEQSGYIFDYQKAIDQLISNVNSLDFRPISLDLMFTEPKIKTAQIGSALNSVKDILTVDSLKLTVDSRWWKLNQDQFLPWLEFQLLDDEAVIGLNQEKVFEFLQPIAELINVEPQDARFELTNDRVTSFQSSRDGKILDLEKSYQKINQQIVIGQAPEIELVVDITPAKVATGDLNNLGIKELLGRGVSNFSGSPKNRRHNIAVGAAALNGILIKPGEEFSLLDALGEIDGAHGYLPELVIKGDRTIPEFGGGLCQIGTTTFRAALRSGLPITQRRNHSYRVIYYEPAGMDATIYNPYPDMKFLNDTGAHILFTTRIEGDELIFELYGTKDGRQVEISPDPPSIYNVTSPGPARYIETEELKPGEKKRVESAHAGADTYFKYTITYPNGEVKEQDFYSHYVPWAEVWLVGKERSATTTDNLIEGVIQN